MDIVIRPKMQCIYSKRVCEAVYHISLDGHRIERKTASFEAAQYSSMKRMLPVSKGGQTGRIGARAAFLAIICSIVKSMTMLTRGIRKRQRKGEEEDRTRWMKRVPRPLLLTLADPLMVSLMAAFQTIPPAPLQQFNQYQGRTLQTEILSAI